MFEVIRFALVRDRRAPDWRSKALYRAPVSFPPLGETTGAARLGRKPTGKVRPTPALGFFTRTGGYRRKTGQFATADRPLVNFCYAGEFFNIGETITCPENLPPHWR